jgi:hypothetical protein
VPGAFVRYADASPKDAAHVLDSDPSLALPNEALPEDPVSPLSRSLAPAERFLAVNGACFTPRGRGRDVRCQEARALTLYWARLRVTDGAQAVRLLLGSRRVVRAITLRMIEALKPGGR